VAVPVYDLDVFWFRVGRYLGRVLFNRVAYEHIPISMDIGNSRHDY
jgi:hypothetical protein